jgi:Flp pilus assembly protein TadG
VSRCQRGGAAAELVLATPLVVVLLLFVVFLGRITQTRGELEGAAHSAARAASMARDPQSAVLAAEQMAGAALSGQQVTCNSLAVAVDTSQFKPGGEVGVTITCTVSLADLGPLHIPNSEALSTHFTEPIDRYEGLG